MSFFFVQNNKVVESYAEDVLKPILDSSLHAHFQQDNLHVHVDHRIINFLQGAEANFIPWPTHFPDLNPMEHM